MAPTSFLPQEKEIQIFALSLSWPYLLPSAPVLPDAEVAQPWPSTLGEAKFNFIYMAERSCPSPENMAISQGSALATGSVASE